ncbi:hypothetical protein B0H13DRAFT_2380118 [Mycena leptocephala]|nr:hypothetical protein B0H13DRAFT_2380118 [Mycena leptocephala]
MVDGGASFFFNRLLLHLDVVPLGLRPFSTSSLLSPVSFFFDRLLLHFDVVPLGLRPFSTSCSLHFDYAQQEPGRMERQRRRELAAITRIRDPIEQCLAHVATPRHKDHGGELYTLFRVVGVDKLEVKSGYSIDTVRRQFEYRDNCVGVEFMWCYKYTCDNVKLLERLVHLTLRARRRHRALRMPGVRRQAPGILSRLGGRGD